MKNRTLFAILTACVVSVPAVAKAQICAGAASFSGGNVRLGASASFSDGAKSYGGELAIGATQGLFVAASAAQISYGGSSSTSTVIGGSIGYSIAAGSTTEFCPTVAYSHTTFPDLNFGTSVISSSENDLGFGGTFGVAVAATPALSLVPFASADYIHVSATASSAGVGSASAAQDYGLLTVGFGMVVDKSLTIRPSVSQPLGVAGSSITVNIGIALNFGHLGAAAFVGSSPR